MDIETKTQSSKPHQVFDELISIQFATDNCIAFIDTQSFQPNDLITLLNPIFRRGVVFFNALYDAIVLTNYGFDINDFDDVAVMATVANEFVSINMSLKSLYAHVTGWILPTYKTIDTEKDEFLVYAVNDAIMTYNLYSVLSRSLKDKGLWQVYSDLERPARIISYKMTRRGVRIDLETVRYKLSQLNEENKKIEKELCVELSIDNIRSTQQLGKALVKKYKAALPRTATGQAKVSADSISKCQQIPDDIKKALSRYKYNEKMLRSFLVNFLKWHKDGILHGEFNSVGTRTGRFSSSRPNLQNIPHGRDLIGIRKLFIPRVGYTFVGFDFSQIELRILAHFSQDKRLLEAYMKDADIHQHTASLLNIDRKTAKTVNFGIVYGLSPTGLSERLNIPLSHAENLIDSFFLVYSGVRKLSETCSKDQDMRVTTILGRKCFIPINKEGDKRKVLNTLIQGSAADIVKKVMVELDKELSKFDAHILIQVHDELLIEVPTHYVPAIISLCYDIACYICNPLCIPIRIDITVGDRWW